MAAVNMHALVARASSEILAKRSNWAAENVGPMVVFCIVGVVAIILIILFILRQLKKRQRTQ